ncbi:FtsQ-type POTRA domain-containing protein [Imbroritus primus]|uniref:FtsQ-type POTRA domain-containing protein n=1 Tax=Imbroritus primus TaxID=3058603 RepID=A0ACD3SPF2_9BURK|nr:FtsQ-type POTRA domain-containing protein [Burkholderiaceae bacterium PBA]
MWHNARLLNMIATALYAVLALVVVAAGLMWLGQRPVFAISHIRIVPAEGSTLRHTNGPSIRANAVPKLQGNFFTLKLDGARNAFESVPWVRRASVRREWPNGLLVELEEHVVLGTWGSGETARLVNVHGEVFVANLAEAEDDARLLALAGPDGSERDVVERLEQLRTWFKPMGVEPLGVTLTDRYAWRTRLSNNTQIELGREQNEQDRVELEARVSRFVQAWPQVVAQWGKQIEYADLRYSNGFAIRAANVRFLTDAQAAAAAKAKAQAQANNQVTRREEKTR